MRGNLYHCFYIIRTQAVIIRQLRSRPGSSLISLLAVCLFGGLW